MLQTLLHESLFQSHALPIALTAAGCLVLLGCLVRFKKLLELSRRILGTTTHAVYRLYQVYFGLIVLFLFGYITAICHFYSETQRIGESVIGTVFFFGANFVFLSCVMTRKLLGAIQSKTESLEEKNTQLEQIESARIFALAAQAELRDNETGLHLERTARYVAILATALKNDQEYREYLTDAYLLDLIRSAPLHDIGKVAIPDAILKKPGKLTAEEFSVIQQHCVHGARIIEMAEQRIEFRSFFQVAVKLVRSHHEKWDGSGYPDGLKAHDIPISAQLMAVADVYDALTSERCYKAAFSHEKAVAIIVESSGTHFNPKVVEAFLANADSFKHAASRLTEARPHPMSRRSTAH